MNDFLMTPQTVYLPVRYMLFMHEFDITVFLNPFNMAEIALVLRHRAVTPGDLRMAFAACIAGIECCAM